MVMTAKWRSARRMSLLAALSVGVIITTASPASAATNLSVDPTTGLQDGQRVTAVGSGFAPHTTVYVVECSNNGSAAERGCNLQDGDYQQATTQADGSFSTALVVRRSFVGIIPGGGGATGMIDCSVAPGCAVFAAVADASSYAGPVTLSFSGSTQR